MDKFAAAVNAAWPGNSALANFRRRVAHELLAINNGPRGPHTAISAKLSSEMRSQHPNLVVAVIRLASDGKLHLKRLIAPGPGAKVPVESIPDSTGAAFLYWIPWPSDVCLILNLPALMKWHAANGSGSCDNGLVGPVTPPNGTRNANAAYSQSQHAAKIANATNSPNGKSATQIAKSQNVVPCEEDYEEQPHAAADVSNGAENPSETIGPRGPSLSDLALPAFPGPAAASQLRRALASRLAAVIGDVAGGLPAHTVPWKQLIPMVAGSRAASIQPALTTPSFFRTFLHHPASAGVFAAVRILRNPADPASSVDCVTLKPQALRRAADVGLDAAIAAAWPGPDPVQRLKRSAAKVLANAWSVAGTFTMNCGPLGLQLKLRQPWAHGVVKPAGIMAALDEGRGGSGGSGDAAGNGGGTTGYLLQVREDGKEGHFRLRLPRLLRDFPSDDVRDLGLGEVPPPTAATSHAPDKTSHSSSCNNEATNNGPVNTATSASCHSNEFGMMSQAVGEFQPTESTVISANNVMGANDPWVSMSAQASYEDASFTADAAAAECVVDSEYVDREGSFACPDPDGISGFLPVSGTNAAGGADTNVDTYAAVPAVAHAYGYVPQQLLPPTVIWVVNSTEMESMCNHCTAVAHVGLAVHLNGADRGAVVALYAPAASAVMLVGPGGSQETVSWVGTVYLVQLGARGSKPDVLSAIVAGDMKAQATASVRMLLESPAVIKVVHGCEQVASLAPICGATTLAPLYDTRLLFTAITAMLPPPPALPPPPYAAVGPLAAVTLTRLGAHVGGLREGLLRTGLWADRPELLSALLDRHAAALRQELFGCRDWACNPAGHETALMAAVQHLPELWDALTYEAVPWVAMAMATSTAAAAMERLATAQAGRVKAAEAAGGGEEVQRVTWVAETGSSSVGVSQLVVTRENTATMPQYHVIPGPFVAPVTVMSGTTASMPLPV